MFEAPEIGGEQREQGKLELIAHRSFPSSPELVYIVDFLNKNLKDKKVMFGLSKDKNNLDHVIMRIYEF